MRSPSHPRARRPRPRRRLLEPVPLEEIGVIRGHSIQALAERTTFLIDGKLAVLCTPLEYRLALRLLRARHGHPLREQPLREALSVDRHSLGKLVTALRRKLFGPLGLEMVTIPRYGYLLEDAEPQRDQPEDTDGDPLVGVRFPPL